MKRFFGHIKNILVHKYWIYHFGRKLGIGRWRLLKHDLSKFSFVEFWESVKYYQGNSSPIPVCKKVNGFSKAWQHHKGHNSHHYEYWTDNYDSGMTLIPMPFECMEEMIADWCAAGRTYQGKEWSIESQQKWWEYKKTLNPSIHQETIKFLDYFFAPPYTLYAGEDKDPFNLWKTIRSSLKEDYLKKIKNDSAI